MGEKKGATESLWLAPTPSKRWCECFFLLYSPVWITWALGIVVPFGIYEHAGKVGYMVICLAASVPCAVVPLFIVGAADKGTPVLQRYWVRANIWIAVFSFIGNYFWTHYFYKLLGASYTFPAWKLNEVPICLYLMTHAYFCFYHALANVLLRRVRNAVKGRSRAVQLTASAALIFALSYATAYGETLTISAFPYYSFEDRDKMYTVGSLFYAIYFFVSFPMFFRMDEDPKRPWTNSQAALDSLAAGMLVTIILDLWRISFGAITEAGSSAAPTGPPSWMA
mmetsp:Transcript_6017/g.10866  ORF Transcript_6017/g.10866 Transcript_6017/m.10866 type:complete len:281 (-) Transcript_6017:216-1058(-)